MLKRRITPFIVNHLQSKKDKILIIEGARQIGKSYIIRKIGNEMFKNFIDINFVEDHNGSKIFEKVKDIEEFYMLLSSFHGEKLGDWNDTLIFLDEIQEYPKYLTWLKFLREDHRYRFIASGSFLGLALNQTTSVPVGSVTIKRMYQLDFEEFLWANGVGADVLSHIKDKYSRRDSLSEALHERIMSLFRLYLLVGGFPDAVKTFLETRNMVEIRQVQEDIRSMYLTDAGKYEKDANKRLLIQRIYNMIPSQMENKKKRLVAKEVDNKKGARFVDYLGEIEYLLYSGISCGVNAISNPKYPLMESVVKNLIKLYYNDVGLLSLALYKLDIKPIMDDEKNVNLGAIYENVVAQELKALGHDLFYYDNKKVGEVDFLIDNFETSEVLPIEVKSGKDYYVHSALNRLLSVKDYGISQAVVFHNNREVKSENGISYLPIYYVMCLPDVLNYSPEPVLI